MIINTGISSTGDITADRVKYGESNVAQALGILENIDASLINSVSALENELTANNTKLYMDYKDGKYGYNTDPLRGADTFNPFNSGIETVLLWTNPNPYNYYNARTITIDLSKYKTVIILAKEINTYNDPSLPYYYITIPSERVYIMTNYNSALGGRRIVSVSNSNIIIGDAYGLNNSMDNSKCIPYKIYGLTENILS